MTTTAWPFRSEGATLLASLRQHLTFANEVWPSRHSPVSRSMKRDVQATRMETMGVLSLVVR